jgi:hypothetical protein
MWSASQPPRFDSPHIAPKVSIKLTDAQVRRSIREGERLASEFRERVQASRREAGNEKQRSED